MVRASFTDFPAHRLRKPRRRRTTADLGAGGTSLPRALVVLLGAAAVVVLAGIQAVAWLAGPVFLALVVVITLDPVRTWLRDKGLPCWSSPSTRSCSASSWSSWCPSRSCRPCSPATPGRSTNCCTTA